MGIGGLFVNGMTSVYRYAKYGKQLGKTAETGVKVYARGGKTTALNADGTIKRIVQRTRRDYYTYHYDTTDYLPFGKTKKSQTTIVKNNKIWKSTFRASDSPYGYGWQDFINSNRTDDNGIRICTDKVNKHGINHRTEYEYNKYGYLIYKK